MILDIINNDPFTGEGQSAITLHDLFQEGWKDRADESTKILLFPSVTCFGQSTRDIDLVVLIKCPEPIAVSTLNDNQTEKIFIRSICCVIEIKDHDSRFVEFTGNTVHVTYKGNKRSNVTKQSENQKYALKNYVENEGFKAPFITNLIWLRNVPRQEIPKNINNILPSTFNLSILLNKIIDNNAHGQSIKRFESKYYLDAVPYNELKAFDPLESLFAKKVVPTSLDRKKLETLTAKTLSNEEVLKNDAEVVVYSGNGGTGKTFYLLRQGIYHYNLGERVLFLTYNTALASDIARLMKLSKIPDKPEQSLRIQTVYSLISSLLRIVGVVPETPTGDFYDQYEKFKNEALEYIENGALDLDDICTIMSTHMDDFDWDVILIDEAQDWPSNEFKLLQHFYANKTFFIADGQSQMIRKITKSSWLSTQQPQKHLLSRSLRLKSNLARFCNSLASEIGFSWSLSINKDLPGGQVIIFIGDLDDCQEDVSSILNESLLNGNQYVDNLVCVPPSLAKSDIQTYFIDVGIKIWDGTDEKIRKSYPSSVKMLRVVQYQSSRGLEGWATFNMALDELYALKKEEFIASNPTLANFETIEDYVNRNAASWLMMILTRAIDTLFIHIQKPDSDLANLLKSIAIKSPDSIHLIEGSR